MRHADVVGMENQNESAGFPTEPFGEGFVWSRRLCGAMDRQQPGQRSTGKQNDSVIHKRLADSASRNSVQCACFLKNDAGHAVLMGPCSAALTATAFRFSGTMQTIFFAEQSAGIVSVSAYGGTDSGSGKWPSPACWRLQASSSFTIFTKRLSLKSATGGSLNARCPFSPTPRQQRSIGWARSSWE